MHRHVVRPPQQVVQRLNPLHPLRAEHPLAQVRVVRDHVQPERLRPRHHCPRDVPQCDQSQRLPANRPHRPQWTRTPAPVPHGPVEHGELLRAGQQQQHRLVRDLRLAEVGEMRDHDPVVRRRRDVECVQPHPVADDELALRHRLHHPPRDLRRRHEDRLRIFHVRDQLVLARRARRDEPAPSPFDDALFDLERDIRALVDVDYQVRFRHAREGTDAVPTGPAAAPARSSALAYYAALRTTRPEEPP